MKLNKVKVLCCVLIIIVFIFAIFKVYIGNKEKNKNNNQVSQQVVYKDEFKIGIVKLDTANPILTKNREMININHLIYEPLLYLDSTYKIQNCLASEYAKTSVTTYILKINTNHTFSNGENVTANDIKNSINNIKAVDNIFSENVKNIENIEVIDDSTLKIILKEETPFFEYNLNFPIVKETENGYIGTGKYKLETSNENQIILVKNQNYNQEKVNENVNKIIINLYNEAGELYNAFKTGKVDIINTSSIIYDNYIGTMGYYIKEYKGREVDFLSCNCSDYLLSQKTIRQAINYAIDSEKIVSLFYNNKYYASKYVLDYNNYACNNVYNFDFSQEKAKELLIKDGWEFTNNRWRKNGGILQLTISVNSSNTKRCEIAQNIKEQLENMGIIVYINKLSDAQYKRNLENKNYQIILTGIYNGYSPDLNFFYGKNNLANYENEEVFSIINEVKNVIDQKNIEEKYRTLIGLTSEESVYICLYRNKNTLLINEKLVGNFEPDNYDIYNNFESWNIKE